MSALMKMKLGKMTDKAALKRALQELDDREGEELVLGALQAAGGDDDLGAGRNRVGGDGLAGIVAVPLLTRSGDRLGEKWCPAERGGMSEASRDHLGDVSATDECIDGF